MSYASQLEVETSQWLLANGPKELESLFRAVVYNPSSPVLVTDDDGKLQDASLGAGKLLGVRRGKVLGRRVTDFTPPNLKPKVDELWRAFLSEGHQYGSLSLVTPNGTLRDVDYVAKGSILPIRHLLVLREKAEQGVTAEVSHQLAPSWVSDYALFLLDNVGHVASWYAGAARIYGFDQNEAVGRHAAFLFPQEGTKLDSELKRALAEGHTGREGWVLRKDGTKLWANCITRALTNEAGVLQGYAIVVRDFTERHERDEKLRERRPRSLPVPAHGAVVGVVSGEFDNAPDMNDAFLSLTGYSREDAEEERVVWADLTPPEYEALDEVAHEECLRFGACTPFEKEFICKDGSRIPVLIATAVLKIAPFQWITFVQDLRQRDAVESVEEEAEGPKQVFDDIVGSSAALRRVQGQIEVVAPTDATVLILGETGTGKELVARAIHRLSPRKHLPFVTLNCAAIPTGLLESELFGYERGAFTGALQQKIGRFEMAHRGTLFLDEVGDIPIDLQPKLLRALQEKSFERLGGTKTIPIDVRLVAATNRNLTQMMGDKLFRSDLYYRLKVFPITTPPLRDRPEDIPLLARFFTRKYAAKMLRDIDKIPTETMNALVAWSWPGNVRELENFIERSVILSRGPNLRAPLDEIRDDAPQPGGSSTLEEVEREHIIRIFRECDGVVTTTATRLGLHRTTLNAMMRKLGISRKDL